MSRLQQKRSGRRNSRVAMGARATRMALDAALAAMGIAQKSWCARNKTQDCKAQGTRQESKPLPSA